MAGKQKRNVETKRFSHAGQGTMGHVVHEPWPLIASKHALRIIPADSRQTVGQDQDDETSRRNRTDEQTERGNS